MAAAKAEEIREHNRYDGLRVKIPVFLDKARIRLQIDIGFGDVIHPGVKAIEIVSILGQDPPRIFGYPLQSVIAEKLEAIISIGMVTSRMKDFYDLYAIATTQELEREVLLGSIRATFSRKQTTLPSDVPVVLSEAFFLDTTNQAQWNGFLKRIEHDPSALPLKSVIALVCNFASPIWDESVQTSKSRWVPAQGWQ